MMNNTRDVILVNRCNQSDEFRTVLPAKMCVHVLLMLAAAAVLVVGAGVGAAATWYVDDGGGVDYDTIQDAVDVAGAGDMIYVYDGTYNEHVVISTSITLSGQTESGVTIDGGGSGDCVQVSSSDVVINGFTITNASKYGIRADYSDIAIENVTITANGGHGIYFVHGKSFAIRNSIIDGNDMGGIVYGGNRATDDAIVEDTNITNNVGSGLRIDLTEGKSATVRNNKIDNNAGSSSDGIYVYIAGTGGIMTIENNPVTNSGGRGIYLRGVRTGSTIANFVVHNSVGSGIRADASDLTLENVKVTDSDSYGIYFVSGKGFAIRNSIIDGNDMGGIVYGGNRATDDAIVEDTNITNNVGSGLRIDLTEGKSATVRNNKIDNNAGSSSDGIYVYIAGTGGIMTIENNPVTNSGGRGIYLRGVRTGSTIANFVVHNSVGSGIRADASDLTLENVKVTDSDSYGIYFVSGKGFAIRNSIIDGNDMGGIVYGGNRATDDAIVEDTNITNNVGSGLRIDLTEGKSATVRNNKIDNNAGSSSDGIYVYIAGTGGIMTIENNRVEDSGRYGIYLTGATNSVVAGNDIMRNSYGMYLHSSSNNSIFHNDFIDNANYNAKDDGTSNSWDDGYPSAGNYWSDHGGADDFKGPGQNQSGNDGIIDTPYPIPGGSSVDRYPLMHPWTGDTPQKGDLNSDGTLTPADAAIALRIAATGAHNDAADVSGDGCVTSLDALMILQAAADAIEL
nr:conserved hypothetical protein [uncultured archaeon]